MRKTLLSLLFLLSGMMAYAAGEKCYNAIPMGKDYHADVQNGQTIWYTASTFDLPLTVTFAPKKGSSDPAPEVEMDFTCVPGFYTDSILCSLFCKTSGGSGIDMNMPHKPTLKSKTVDGQFVYYLSLGKQYRDLLLKMGISYAVDVFVKVTYKSAGTIQLAPDDLFSNCVDGAKFMQYGDTVQVAAKDTKRHVTVPYVQWQEDTVLYIWDNEATSYCQLVVENTCDFDPLHPDEHSIHNVRLEPGDTLKVKAEKIYEYVHNEEFPPEAGMYFAKFYSAASGVMKVEKAKQAPPRGGATLLRYGFTYPLDANSTAVFAIPTSWIWDTKFTTPTMHIFKMKIATDPDFSDAHTIAQYQFAKTDTCHWQGITGDELKKLWSKTAESFLYVRFECTEATTISPDRWVATGCFASTTYLPFAQEQQIQVIAKDTKKYKIYLKDWTGGDMQASFSKPTSKCVLFVDETCAFPNINESSSEWLTCLAMNNAQRTITISQATLTSWTDVADGGYIYLRFYTTVSGGGYVTLKSGASAEADPEYPHTTISAKCEGGKVIVGVNKAQHISVDGTSEEWDAVPGEPHTLNLNPGTYTLQGESETIEITLP